MVVEVRLRGPYFETLRFLRHGSSTLVGNRMFYQGRNTTIKTKSGNKRRSRKKVKGTLEPVQRIKETESERSRHVGVKKGSSVLKFLLY